MQASRLVSGCFSGFQGRGRLRLPAWRSGKADADSGSLVFFAFEFDAGVVQFGDMPDDGESQSGAFCLV